MTILLVGECGTGKTWVMRQLLGGTIPRKIGLIAFHEAPKYLVIGKYDGTTFAGSDRLAMNCIVDVPRVLHYAGTKHTVWEGDRFTNSRFIKPDTHIILIKGNGAAGRLRRGSNQSPRQLKAIATRVSKVIPSETAENSSEALMMVQRLIK